MDGGGLAAAAAAAAFVDALAAAVTVAVASRRQLIGGLWRQTYPLQEAGAHLYRPDAVRGAVAAVDTAAAAATGGLLDPFVQLLGGTAQERHCRHGPRSVLQDAAGGDGCVKQRLDRREPA